MQLAINKQKITTQRKIKGYIFSKVGDFFNLFYQNHLPFNLTGAQKRVVKEIRKDLGSGVHMNRLLQGDVGSGKTIVSLIASLNSVKAGFSSCFYGANRILARQHYNLAKELFDDKINLDLLSSKSRNKNKKLL